MWGRVRDSGGGPQVPLTGRQPTRAATGPTRQARLGRKPRPLRVHHQNIDILQRLVSADQVWLGLGRLSLISTDFCPPAFGQSTLRREEEAARQPCGEGMHVISHAEKPWISIPCSAEVRSETAFSSAANTARNRIGQQPPVQLGDNALRRQL